MKFVYAILMFSSFAEGAESTQWIKMNAADIHCSSKNDVVFLAENATAQIQIVAFFAKGSEKKAYQKCMFAVAQARQDKNSVMINLAGEVVPEDGFFVRLSEPVAK